MNRPNSKNGITLHLSWVLKFIWRISKIDLRVLEMASSIYSFFFFGCTPTSWIGLISDSRRSFHLREIIFETMTFNMNIWAEIKIENQITIFYNWNSKVVTHFQNVCNYAVVKIKNWKKVKALILVTEPVRIMKIYRTHFIYFNWEEQQRTAGGKREINCQEINIDNDKERRRRTCI